MTVKTNGAAAMIEQVREGMQVVDVAGHPVGPVELVHMGDRGAATTQGSEMAEPWPMAAAEALADRYAEPRVPEPLRSRLLIAGYVKVDGPGPDQSDTDLYVAADAIASVEGETVRLKIDKARMIAECADLDLTPVMAAVPAGALWWISLRGM